MSDTIITVDGIGKKYRIRHQRALTLRDAITDKAASAFQWVQRRSNIPPAIEDFWALKDVSFDVKRGEIIGIVGRNGAGKSTLLKILSRITEPTEGRVTIGGRVASLLEVGTGFHLELTGRENIYLNGAILGMFRAEIKRKFDEIVAFAEIEKFLDTPVKHYSSGMYVRLAFAVAAHLEPEILVVDEVLAVGDIEFQKKCLGKMQDVSRTGRTILFVSHNIAMVRALCTSGLLLDKGVARSKGTIESVTDIYLSRDAGESGTLVFAPSSVEKPQFKNIASDKERYSSGEFMKLNFELVSPKNAKVAIEFEIFDERGTRLFYSSTAPMHGHLFDLRANCPFKTTIEIGPLLLARGDYSIHFWLIKPWQEEYHATEQPLHFSVDFSDPAGVGYDFKQAWGRGAVTIPMRIIQ